MKKIAVFVLGVIVGLAGYAIARDKLPGNPPPSSGANVPVTQLSPEAEKALGLTKNEALVATIGFDGKMRFFRPSGVQAVESQLPTAPVTIHNLEAMGLLTFSASPPCILVRIGGEWVKVCKQ